ncbi:hypothetical protein JTE90_018716 [Oedothorax gibbosus]|uniref:Cytochrome P450 n=1 Tax=Oedothorax gibbosus TaxID=931172 RepID=A0AAV6TYJ5_9ARAC|nr:hypothetical protein JTE90_018716 [Oedothorax gibbosus]
MLNLEYFPASWAVTGLIGITTVILLYWYSTNNHDYWAKRGIPFDKPVPFLGSFYAYFKKPLHEVELDRHLKYGSVYGHFEGTKPVLSVGDPTLLRDILVKDFAAFPSHRSLETGNKVFDSMLSNMKGDENWKRIRTIVTPTFTTGKIKRMLGIFKECSKILVQNFKNIAKEGKHVDAKGLYAAFSMDVIASSAFSTKIDSHSDPNNQFVTTTKQVFSKEQRWRFLLWFTVPRLVKFLRMKVIPEDMISFFKNATLQIIEERKRTGQTRNDFLQLLMDTAKETDDGDDKDDGDIASNYGVHEDIHPQILRNVTAKDLSKDELVAQCIIFFIGGHETAAVTLSFASYLLALHPDSQDRVRQEVDRALADNGGKVTYEAIKDMKYLDDVISETLRLYPPALRIDRVAEFDYKLGDTGITVPKGMIVTIPIYAVHRDPNLFPDPEKFNPDRFTPEERGQRDQYSYLPFGAGPRNCVANRFALMEVKVCLAHVIASFNIKTCPETNIPLKFGLGQGLLQPEGIILAMEIRKESVLSDQRE